MSGISLANLPGDVLYLLFKELPFSSINKLSRTATLFKSFVKDNLSLWLYLKERDFPHRSLTFSQTPYEQYLEQSGLRLYQKAAVKEIKLLKTFQGMNAPYKVFGHLVIGTSAGQIIAHDLHKDRANRCEGRPRKASITALDVYQDEKGVIHVYAGDREGSVETWNLTNQKWSGWFSHFTYCTAIASLEIAKPNQIAFTLEDNSTFFYKLTQEYIKFQQPPHYRIAEENSDLKGSLVTEHLHISWASSLETKTEIQLSHKNQKTAFQTLTLNDTLFQVKASPALLVGYSKKTKNFYVWG
jgi:hypothetical protein